MRETLCLGDKEPSGRKWIDTMTFLLGIPTYEDIGGPSVVNVIWTL